MLYHRPVLSTVKKAGRGAASRDHRTPEPGRTTHLQQVDAKLRGVSPRMRLRCPAYRFDSGVSTDGCGMFSHVSPR